MMPKWTHIIVHHSWTRDGQVVDTQSIRRHHTQVLGWGDIGYHYTIEMVGDRYEILKGRMLTRVGAHCREHQMNSKGIGICCIGNFDKEKMPVPQFDMLIGLIEELQETFMIPKENVDLHRSYNINKSCPGWMVGLDDIRSRLL